MIDQTTPFGQRVARRLDEERIIWLTTVSATGVPHPRPVWFWWDGESFLIYSKPDTFKHGRIKKKRFSALEVYPSHAADSFCFFKHIENLRQCHGALCAGARVQETVIALEVALVSQKKMDASQHNDALQFS